MKILVTGGAGYIGSHTAVSLIQHGHDIVLIDNFSNSYPFILNHIQELTGKEIPFYQIDITDRNALIPVFTDHPDIDAVIHFAAFKAVGESVQKPLMYYENNFFSLLNLIHVMQENGCRNIIFSSSCSVYGNTNVLPVTEETPFMPAESPYGYSKQVGEIMLRDISQTGNISCIALRYFNPVGAHPSGLLGELPIGMPGNLVPVITQCAAGLRPPVVIFGSDYPTRDGTCIRDYIHVCDLADAHVAAAEYINNKNGLEIFNVGTGNGTSVLEAIKAFQNATGLELPFQMGSRRDGDVVQIWSDVTKSANELHWKTKYTIEDAMVHAWNWQNNLPGFKEKYIYE